MVRCEKLNGKLDDEIKRAGVESLLAEELEKHLIYQLHSFGDFRGFELGGCEVCGGEIRIFRIRDF